MWLKAHGYFLLCAVVSAWLLLHTGRKRGGEITTNEGDRHQDGNLQLHKLDSLEDNRDDKDTIRRRTTVATQRSVFFQDNAEFDFDPANESMNDIPSTATSVSCPPNGNTAEISAGIYTITFASDGTLCTLTRREEGTVYSVARSYDGYPWEIAAGEFASSFFNAKISCSSNTCSVTLPTLEAPAKYYLTAYDHSISSRDELARFLESATFGITQSGIQDLENLSSGTSEEKISKWVEDQMNIPYTSHRKFWREGANPRVRLVDYHSQHFTCITDCSLQFPTHLFC